MGAATVPPVTESSTAVCEYAKLLASMTVMPEKVPLKLVFFVETPLIKMVPGFAGLML